MLLWTAEPKGWELSFAVVLPAATDTYLPCQGEKANDWLSKRLDRMLPVPHFMITFTVPAPFRQFFRSHQSFAYSNLFKSSSFVLKKLASENTYFDGDIPGFFLSSSYMGKTASISSSYPLHRSRRRFLFFRL